MTKTKALEIVASMLAVDCKRCQDTAREYPGLATNAYNMVDKNVEIAQALDIEETFRSKCRIHEARL